MWPNVDDRHINPTPPAGFDGVATYLRTTKSYVPTNVAGGDDTAISAAFALAGVGEVAIDAGTARVNATVIGKAGVSLVGLGTSRTKFVSYVASGGGPAGGCIQYTNAYGTAGTLAGIPTPGSNVVTSTKSVAVGSAVYIQSAADPFEETIYIIRAKSGGPTYTYTLDRTLQRIFTTGDAFVPVTTLITGVRVAGFTLTGNTGMGGPRGLNWIGAYRVLVEDVTFDSSGGGDFDEAMSFETNSVECTARRVRVDGPGGGGSTMNHGLLSESGERHVFDSCFVDRTSNGYYCIDSVDIEYRDCGSGHSTNGLVIGTTVGLSGCRNIRAIGGGYHGASGAGISIGLCDGFLGVGTSTYGCGSGVVIGGSSKNVTLQQHVSDRCTWGVVINSGATQTRLMGCTTKNSVTYGVSATGEFNISDHVSTSDGSYGLYDIRSTGGTSTLSRARMSGSTYGIYANSTIPLVVRDANLSGMTVGVNVIGTGAVTLDNVECTNSATADLSVGAGATAIIRGRTILKKIANSGVILMPEGLAPALLEVASVTEWFDTDSGLVMAGANKVSSWVGRKYGSQFVQATALNQPTLAGGAIGGRAGLIWDGTNTKMVHDTAWNTFLTTTTGSIYFVLRPVAITLNTGNPLTDNVIFADSNTRLSLGMDSAGSVIQAGAHEAGGYEVSGTTPLTGIGSPDIITWRHKASKVGVRKGSAAFVEATCAAIDTPGGFLHLGSTYDDSTKANVYIGAVVFASADLSAAEDLRILSALTMWAGGAAAL